MNPNIYNAPYDRRILPVRTMPDFSAAVLPLTDDGGGIIPVPGSRFSTYGQTGDPYDAQYPLPILPGESLPDEGAFLYFKPPTLAGGGISTSGNKVRLLGWDGGYVGFYRYDTSVPGTVGNLVGSTTDNSLIRDYSHITALTGSFAVVSVPGTTQGSVLKITGNDVTLTVEFNFLANSNSKGVVVVNPVVLT